MLQLERQLRLAVARYKEQELELGQLRAKVEQLRRQTAGCEQPAAAQGQPSMPAGEAQPQESPVAVPQPAEDRCRQWTRQSSSLTGGVLCIPVAAHLEFSIAPAIRLVCDIQLRVQARQLGSIAIRWSVGTEQTSGTPDNLQGMGDRPDAYQAL